MGRITILLLLFGLLLGVNGQGSTPMALMQQANDAYLTGDYAVAADLYEQIVAQGVSDPTVYYNLGTAYYQQRQLGLALVNYLRSQAISPRSEALTTNIALIRAERADFQGTPRNLIDQFAAASDSTFTLLELGWVVLLLWSLWFTLWVIWWLRRRWQPMLRYILVISGMFLLLGLALFLPRAYAEANRPEAIVVTLSAPVMSGPGDDYLEIYQLYAAAEMRVLETQGAWARFVLPDGRQGWIEGNLIAFV